MQKLAFNFNGTNEFTGLIDQNGNPWFIVNEICNVLGLSNVTRVVERLDEDEKQTLQLVKSGQERKTWITSESGLYHLIFTSQKDEAKAFRKWVTGTVLPEIRKTGGFNKEAVLKTTLNFKMDLLYFKKQVSSAIRKIENRISNVAMGTLQLDSSNLFEEEEGDLGTLVKDLKKAIDVFSDKLEGYTKKEVTPV